MRILLPIVFLLFFHPISGQNFIEIKGRVVDSTSGNPLSFAQISLHHTGIGTTSNEDGNFHLDIPAGNREDTLLIYYLGYETRKIPVKACLVPSVEISLKTVILQLSEVEVIGLTPQEVIRRAVEGIPANYGKNPLILTAFIRSQKYRGWPM
ncbi:MAG: carboxypeptidase-like regulatory domain-containing protein, partial [Bacteroidales bacterium]